MSKLREHMLQDLSSVEASDLTVVDAARQRLGRALHEIRRGAAEDEEAGTQRPAIGQDPQQLEERRLSLELVAALGTHS